MADASVIGANIHRPVLIEAAVDALCPWRDGGYIDATFGGGGHSRRILQQLSPSSGLFALDCDEYAAARADALVQEVNDTKRFVFERCNFAKMQEAVSAVAQAGMTCMQQVQGVLFDLGMSSLQVDSQERGLSFMQNGPLDMRFDRRESETAQTLIQHIDAKELSRILREYGEEPESRRLAHAIIEARAQLTDTESLAQLVAKHKRHHPTGRHPATLVFQALRMAVNREVESLRHGLAAACALLVQGGRLAVIAFHSLEERIVKRALSSPTFPNMGRVGGSGMRPLGKAISASADEVADNRRARSARLRIYEKVA